MHSSRLVPVSSASSSRSSARSSASSSKSEDWSGAKLGLLLAIWACRASSAWKSGWFIIRTNECWMLIKSCSIHTWRTVASEAPCSRAAFNVASGWLDPSGLRIIRFRRRESSSHASSRQNSRGADGAPSPLGDAQAPCFDTMILVMRSTRRNADEASRRRAALIMWSQTPSSSRRSRRVWAHCVYKANKSD